MSDKPHLAWIGTGIMGLPMAGHLIRAGYPLTVHNRTVDRARPLLDAGAKLAGTPRQAAAEADVVLICVTDTPDVEAVLFGDDGLERAARQRPGLVIVDHSTISPTATQAFAKRLAEHGAALIDAPVSGGDTGARNGTLSIMCGGDARFFSEGERGREGEGEKSDRRFVRNLRLSHSPPLPLSPTPTLPHFRLLASSF